MVENDAKDTSKYLPTLCVKKIIFVNVQVKVIYQVIWGWKRNFRDMELH